MASRRPKKPRSRSTSSAPRDCASEIHRRLESQTARLVRRCREVRAALTRFHEEDMPAFEAWIEEHLAQERDEMDRLSQEADFHFQLLDLAEVTQLTAAQPLSRSEAMAMARKELEGTEEEPADYELADFEPAGDEGPAPHLPDDALDALFRTFMAAARGIDTHHLDDDAYEKARSEFAASFEHAAAGNQPAFERALLRAGADDGEENRAAVKAVYRRLAKRLHPDHQGEIAEADKELWELATLQHEALDLAGIEETEATLFLLRSEPVPSSLSPVLLRLQRSLKDTVDDVEMELDGARFHAAWEFSLKKNSAAYLERIRQGLLEELADCRQQAARVKARVARWSASTPVKRPPPERKRIRRQLRRPRRLPPAGHPGSGAARHGKLAPLNKTSFGSEKGGNARPTRIPGRSPRSPDAPILTRPLTFRILVAGLEKWLRRRAAAAAGQAPPRETGNNHG